MRGPIACLFLATCWGAMALAQEAPQASLQQRFDAATAAFDSQDCATALRLLDGLAADPKIKPGGLPAAMITMRRGICLVNIGHADTGEPLLAGGLAGIRAHPEGLAADIAMAEDLLGLIAAQRADHDGALAHYDAALASASGVARSTTLQHIALLTAFDGDSRAIDAANEGLKLWLAQPKPDKTMLAQWHVLLGRTLLNRGKVKEGRAELQTALKLSGGLSDRISVFDAALRQDLAQAALLGNMMEDAHHYMTMSGAGHAENNAFSSAAVMEPPPCGPESGLDPQDVAVVQLLIDTDGSVMGSQTVYTTGNYAKASAFSRAVQSWQWTTANAAKMPPFFRATARVALRCARDGGGLSPAAPLQAEIATWAHRMAPDLPYEKKAWQAWLAAADAARQRGDAPAELAARLSLAEVDLRADADVISSIDRALILAQDPGLPQNVRNSARVLLSLRRDRAASGRVRKRDGHSALLAVKNEAAIAADPIARSAATLLLLPQRPAEHDMAATVAALQHVANDDALAPHHPLRQFALLRLANQAAAQGQLDEAQRLFAATGLTQEQCALIGPKPALKRVGSGPEQFPSDLNRWGFEGWVRSEFDIQADGRTAALRPVISYPPFVFDEAATSILASARFQSSYRPENGAACSANFQMINFAIPGNMMTAKEIKKKS